MRICPNSLTVAFVALSFFSSVNGRSVNLREAKGLQHDSNEHEGAHWGRSAPEMSKSTSCASSQPTPDVRQKQGEQEAKENKPEWLRIMPLGASITRGLKSKPEDGFRKHVRDQLVSDGFKVNMVGSQSNKDGSMQDGEHEGHSGHRIDQVIKNLDLCDGSRPNLYLINAGTNDCQQNYLKMKGTTDRIHDLLNKAWEKSERATIVLSTLLLSNNDNNKNGANERVTALNKEIRALANKLKNEGRRIQLADMNDGYITKADLVDGIHPTGPGYKKMANVWMDAINKARKDGMLQSPEDNGVPDDAPGNPCAAKRQSKRLEFQV